MGLKIKQVFRVDAWSLIKIGLQWLWDLIFGGLVAQPIAQSLVDTAPLRKLLRKVIRSDQITKAIEEEKFKCLAITATEVYTGSSVTFVQAKNFKAWRRARRRSDPAVITADHVLGSAAIPFLFPSVLVGKKRYVDGCIRSTTPLGPAARLGANKILAVGVRKIVNLPESEIGNTNQDEPKASAAKLASLVLNSLFSESLDADAEHLERLNAIVDKVPETHELGMRKIDILVIRPSEDLGKIASEYESELPPLVRYLLRGLGATSKTSGDVLSYLLFVPGYTSKLIEIGYNDAKAMDDKIRDFFAS
jgi:NTE family protein